MFAAWRYFLVLSFSETGIESHSLLQCRNRREEEAGVPCFGRRKRRRPPIQFYIEMLGDKEVVDKLRAALFPSELAEELRALRTQITRLNETIESKDKVIGDLQARVVKLEDSLDDTEQYSRRANLRMQGIPDPGTGEDACAKVLDVINNAMMFQPPLSTNDIVRSHRLGRQTDPARPRMMIVRFQSERTGDSVYYARSALKTRNQDVQPALRLFVNEDLTQRRSLMAYQTRKLRADKI